MKLKQEKTIANTFEPSEENYLLFFSKASHILICVKLYFSSKRLPSSTSAMFARDDLDVLL